LKDDLFKKIKTILSGSSVQLEEKVDKKIIDKQLNDEELINSFMNQILDASWLEEDLKASCAPSYRLSSKEKSYWLMNTTVKSMFNIKGGIEIVPIEVGLKYTSCLIGQSIYSIPNSIIICSGWN
tara:strand:+ start:1264 stop:1638 length:375 start_codon:yes stop_codon:yes gene_type:complete